MVELQPGQRLSHFRILSLLGRGGMGVVYLARDERLQRRVALKVLPASVADDPSLRARLQREARAAARLNHPNIAAVYEVGEDDRCDFVAMEYVQGSTLRALIDAAGGGLDPRLVIDYAVQAASALAAAHAAGLVHRDVKPENLVVTHDGRVKVLDFGLARRCESTETPLTFAVTPASASSPSILETLELGAADTRLTLAGMTTGTPAYMAPEQVRGIPPEPAADVFSLGVVIFEMLTGRSPFARPGRDETLRAILTEPAPPAAGIDPRLEAVLRTALSKDPLRRYRSGRELVVALKALTPLPAPASLPGEPDRMRDGAARRMRSGSAFTAALAGALALALIGLGAVAFLWLGRHQDRAGPRPPSAAEAPPPAAPPPGLRLRPLRVAPGLDQHPVLSPDGTKVVFARDGRLAVIPAASGGVGAEPIMLTARAGETRTGGAGDDDDRVESEPDWSPDGTTIAFTCEESGGAVAVCAVPAEGGPVRRIVVGASSPSWSPDGRRIAFVQRGLGRSSAILTVEADGRWSRTVTRPEAAFFHLDPAWSPDGGTIAFVKDPGGGAATEIWLAPSDGGGEPRQLTREAEGIYSTSPRWTPDGGQILYASNRAGTRNIWMIPVSGGAPSRLTAGQGEDNEPDISKDGKRVVFAISSDKTALLVAGRAGRRGGQGAREDVQTLVIDPVGILWGPAFSADGRFIAYTRIDKGGPWDLYVVPAAGGTPRQLDTGGASSLWPRWSPDGTSLVYCTFGKGDDDIWVISASGGAPRRLTEGDGDDWWPTWSPDGRTIVFSRTEADKSYLYRVPAAGGAVTRLSQESLTLPDFSPDGRFLAVARNRSYRNGVGILPLDGGELRWLTDTGGWPVFRPDGKAVGFVRLEPGALQSLWEAPIAGGEPRRIEGPRFTFWNFPFDYAPDGRGVVTSNNLAVESDLWMLEMP